MTYTASRYDRLHYDAAFPREEPTSGFVRVGFWEPPHANTPGWRIAQANAHSASAILADDVLWTAYQNVSWHTAPMTFKQWKASSRRRL